MTKEEYLALCEKQFEATVKLNDHDNFYDHEKGFVEVIRELGREVLQANLGHVPANHQKKTEGRPASGG